jgi:hypothetical protein
MRFEILKHSPRRAHRRVNDDKLALLMDTPTTERPTPLLEGRRRRTSLVVVGGSRRSETREQVRGLTQAAS